MYARVSVFVSKDICGGCRGTVGGRLWDKLASVALAGRASVNLSSRNSAAGGAEGTGGDPKLSGDASPRDVHVTHGSRSSGSSPRSARSGRGDDGQCNAGPRFLVEIPTIACSTQPPAPPPPEQRRLSIGFLWDGKRWTRRRTSTQSP